MHKERITYTDYNGTERTEEFYFNLTKAEIVDMELTTDGGLEAMIQKIVDSKDSKKIVETFKNLINKAYGIKSDDGRRFMKSEEISKAFTETEAYSDLYIRLSTNADDAIAFVRGIIPGGMENVPNPIPENAK